jgi:hypothetical protein
MAGSITISSIILDSDNNFSIRSNTGATLFSANNSGLVTPAGTVSLPAITTTGDTNTGIFFPAADTIAFTEGGVESMRIDSSGNVGIGTDSPSFSVDVVRSGGNAQLRLMSQATGTNGIIFRNNAAPTSAKGAILYPNGSAVGGDTMQFVVDAAERMRIDSSGNVAIGNTSALVTSSGRGNLTINGSSSAILVFGVAGVSQGYIFNNGTDLTTLNDNVGAIIWENNGAERMRINSSGNLLVGATSPVSNSKFLVAGVSSATSPAIQASSSAGGYLYFYNNAQSSDSFQIGQGFASGTDNVAILLNNANAAMIIGTNGTERMRITSAGDLLVGATATSAFFDGRVSSFSATLPGLSGKTSGGAAMPAITAWNTATSGDNFFLQFATEASATGRGSITYNRAGGLTAYNTTSDYRSKDIISNTINSGEVIDSVPVYMGKMKGATQARPMFIAHETPDYAHTGEKDAVDKDGNPVYQQMDASSLVPVLWAEVQSLRKRLALLESN